MTAQTQLKQRPKTRGAIEILVLLFGACVARADLQLEFESTVKTTPHQQASDPPHTQPQQPETETTPLHLTLGEGYFSFQDDQRQQICDFSKRVIYDIHLKAGTYTERSLYSDVGFRVYELKNRMMIGEVLDIAEAAKSQKISYGRVLVEHLFSLPAEGDPVALTPDQNDTQTVYAWQGKPLAQISRDVVEVDPTHRDAFIRFLRYFSQGHPQILEHLNALTGIPSQLTVTQHNMGRIQSKSLTYRSHKVTPSQPYNLEGLEETQPKGDLTQLLAQAPPAGPDAINHAAQQVLADADAAFTNGQHLDAMLAYLEYTLMTGQDMHDWLEPKRDQLVADPHVVTLMSALKAKSKNGAKQTIQALSQLKETAQSHEHVLLIFEANTHTSLGHPGKSIPLFHQALLANPLIVGAWKDLGDLYRITYQMPDAWRCWDHARTILPTHRMLTDLNHFEDWLVANHPGFF